MNKKIVLKIIILLIIIVAIILLLYLAFKEPTDNIRFKQEYESLNGEYISINVPEDNLIKYANFDDVIDLFDSGTGILYIGYPECSLCREAIVSLIEVATEEEVSQIYYFNARSIRDKKVLVDGKVVTKKEGTNEYNKLVSILSDYLPSYRGLKDESIKRIYFPTFVFVMGGKIVGFNYFSTDVSNEELEKIYRENINNMFGSCDELC